MTTLVVVDGDRDETRSEAASRRLRGEFAERKLSAARVAALIGVKQPWLSRRMTGEVPLDLDTVDNICNATGISYAYITSGIKEAPVGPAGPAGPDGGEQSLLSGLNRRPSAYKVPAVASIIAFPSPATRDDEIAA